jgi:SHS2 domain-containing protein
MRSETAPTGVTALNHTADVGIMVEAPTREELFLRAAAGMTWLLEGGEERGDPWAGGDEGAEAASGEADGGRRESGRSSSVSSATPAESRELSASAPDPPALLREWLRELLFWYEVEGLAFDGARFEELSGTALKARVDLLAAPEEPIREIKGVTLHGLVAERHGEAWTGRVIFDV